MKNLFIKVFRIFAVLGVAFFLSGASISYAVSTKDIKPYVKNAASVYTSLPQAFVENIQVDTDAANNVSANVIDSIVNFFRSLFTSKKTVVVVLSPTPTPIATATRRVVATPTPEPTIVFINVAPTPPAIKTTTGGSPVYQTIRQTIVQGVSENELTIKLKQLTDAFNFRINNLPPAVVTSGGLTQEQLNQLQRNIGLAGQSAPSPGSTIYYPNLTNPNVTGNLSASGDISANAFFGDGSHLTGISGGGGSGNSAFTIGNGLIYNATTTDNVGIGTTTPSHKLTVGGDINFTGNLYQNGALFSSGGGSGNSAFTIGNGVIYNATTTDNVGIGTTSPIATLTVKGKPGTNPFIIASSTGTSMVSLDQNGDLVVAGRFGIGSVGSPLGSLFSISGTGAVPGFSLSNINVNASSSINAASFLQANNVSGGASATIANQLADFNRLGLLTSLGNLTVTAPVAKFSDNCVILSGTCTSSADVLQITQDYTSNTGAALNLSTAGTGAGLRVNDDGTFTDSTPFLITAVGDVGIGTTTPSYKLTVVGDGYFSNTLISATTTATSTIAGGLSVGDGALTHNWASGVTSISSLETGALNFDSDAGVISWVDLPVTTTSASGTVQSYSAQIDSNPVLTVFGLTDNVGGVNSLAIGIGTTTPTQMLTVSGTIQATNLLGGATTLSTDANGNIIRTPSDFKLKENIEPITGALDKVLQLQGVSYNFKDATFGTTTQIGFIAQDVQLVFPEVISTGGDYLSLNYGNLVAALVEAIKELAHKVQSFAHWFSDDGAQLKVQGDVCVDDVCVTKGQFKILIEGAGATPNNTPTPTPEIIPTPTPEPTATPEPTPTPEE